MKKISHAFVRRALPLILSAFACILAGCAAPVGAARVAPDSGQQCAEQCATMEMKLSAVALMAGNVGCVCQDKSEGSTTPGVESHASGTAGGMVAVLMQQQAEEERQRQANQSY